MKVNVFPNAELCSKMAARLARQLFLQVVPAGEQGDVVFAAAMSQDLMLKALVADAEMPWGRVRLRHMDEYIGVTMAHPASFRLFLRERLKGVLGRLPSAEWIKGEAEEPVEECARLSRLFDGRSLSLLLCGVGENGHLAFNDPPCAIGNGVAPYLVVSLDEACRKQQVGEGWFKMLADVPKTAITASVPFMLTSKATVCTVLGPKKAAAVKAMLKGPITPDYPASYLRTIPEDRPCFLMLDEAAASEAGLKPGRTYEFGA